MRSLGRRNQTALKRVVAQGAKLRAFPRDVIEALKKANDELMADYAAKSPAFAKVHQHYMAFLRESQLWHSINEDAVRRWVAEGLK
jgi:TRAP-type mannitol/chloroaromatic compound transport system substrate-binding protein